jgi:hypothetical protein
MSPLHHACADSAFNVADILLRCGAHREQLDELVGLLVGLLTQLRTNLHENANTDRV